MGDTMASSIASGLVSSAGSSHLWNIVNVIQTIEVMALIELPYPEKLEQFFDGYKFALLLNSPSMHFMRK